MASQQHIKVCLGNCRKSAQPRWRSPHQQALEATQKASQLTMPRWHLVVSSLWKPYTPILILSGIFLPKKDGPSLGPKGHLQGALSPGGRDSIYFMDNSHLMWWNSRERCFFPSHCQDIVNKLQATRSVTWTLEDSFNNCMFIVHIFTDSLV